MACASSGARVPGRAEPAAECVVAVLGPADTARAPAAGVARHAAAAAPSAPALVRDTITVALTTPVSASHAPWPRSDGERFLFAQLYESLLREDCSGRILPGLARSWNRVDSPAPGLTRWRFILRPDARFSGGYRVTAADVIASWNASALAHEGEPASVLVATIARGAEAADDSTLLVSTPDSLASLRTFASSFLRVARPESAEGWPDGTTSYDLTDPRAAAEVGAGTEREIGMQSRGGEVALRVRVAPGADARDILDAGTTLLVTSSTSAIQYARAEGSRASIPLPWTRSYVLALSERYSGTPAPCVDDDVRALRDSLAAAVHAEARGAGGAGGAEGAYWWLLPTDSAGSTEPSPSRCPDGAGVVPGTAPPTGTPDRAPSRDARDRAAASRTRIVYPLYDATARDLAERIVALAAPGREEPAAAAIRRVAPELSQPRRWRAVGLDSLAFASSLTQGADPAYILALPRRAELPPAARGALTRAAPWLTPPGRASALLPLVDTRETLLIRRERGIPRMTIMHDGTIVLGAPSTAASGRAP